MDKPFLSIILPAYNEETRLPRALGQVFEFVEQQPYTCEVLVVDNGSVDGTLAAARRFEDTHPQLRILHEEQRGKGRAVRLGMLAAGGEYRFAADVDFSMPVEDINRFLPPACNADIAIASREAPGSTRIGEPYYRHFTGRVFNNAIRLLVLPGLQDTQCGFKCFKGEVAEDLFRYQTLPGWAFDVEMLVLARHHGYQVVEIPITWYYNAGSRVSLLRDSLRMFLDLLTIRRNAKRGLYDRRD